MKQANRPLSVTQIEEFEEHLGCRLPEVYLKFLQTQNGGRPENGGFVILRDGEDYGILVDWFLGLQEGDCDHLIEYQVDYKGRVPANLLPIAHDSFGNFICLSVWGRDIGKVYYWDHEEEAEEGETPDYHNVYFVADDFQSFLNSLS